MKTAPTAFYDSAILVVVVVIVVVAAAAAAVAVVVVVVVAWISGLVVRTSDSQLSVKVQFLTMPSYF